MALLEEKSGPNTLCNLRQGISEQISPVSLAMLLRVMESVMNKVHNLYERNLAGIGFKNNYSLSQ
jgi:hypothetical protein